MWDWIRAVLSLFIGGRELGGEGVESQDIGGVECAGEEKAGGVVEGDKDRGGGTLVALGEVEGEFVEKEVFVSDLWIGGLVVNR